MNSSEKLTIISNTLNELYPETHCFLHYEKDYELLFCVMLSAQATDESVNKVTKVLFKRYPSLQDLASAEEKDILEIIKSVGLGKTKSKNLLATSKIIHEQYKDEIPLDRDVLVTFPGIGYKTATVFLAETQNLPSIPVDTHIFRVINRLNVFPNNKYSADQMSMNLDKSYKGNNHINFHRQLILFGRNICSAKKMNCEVCPFKNNLCEFIKENR